MPRSIKKIVHDLLPLSDSITELSSIVSILLTAMQSKTLFEDDKTGQYYRECTIATEKLAISATLIKKYIQELSDETNNEESF